ncbi:MAG: RidA family protein [Melioribacteraceae bacterium]|nr:RidA family protein [Melioribacteraceae bacterium]MCF8266352.1 RidA family protein [Melioribacteraceae bacterium]MCF8431947.1 RidA family protein [Melioribacteraceae bacterium]
MQIEEKLKELGHQLPEIAKPLASYIPATVVDGFVYTSGQVPILKGELIYKGKVGSDLTLNEGQMAAQMCILNCLAAIKGEIGDLDKIERIVKLTVFVQSAEGFTDQPKVANGASDLLQQVFGDAGKHARSAVGVIHLPIGSAVEIEMIAKIRA